MAYATVIHVLSRNAARATFTASSIPNVTQVTQHIVESAAQLDQWLLAGGYAAPFDAAIASGAIATSGQVLLQRWNSIGAALAIEEAAQASDRVPIFERMWNEVKKVIIDRSIDVPLPMLAGKAIPRGLGQPGVNGGGPASPEEFLFSPVSGSPYSKRGWDL